MEITLSFLRNSLKIVMTSAVTQIAVLELIFIGFVAPARGEAPSQREFVKAPLLLSSHVKNSPTPAGAIAAISSDADLMKLYPELEINRQVVNLSADEVERINEILSRRKSILFSGGRVEKSSSLNFMLNAHVKQTDIETNNPFSIVTDLLLKKTGNELNYRASRNLVQVISEVQYAAPPSDQLRPVIDQLLKTIIFEEFYHAFEAKYVSIHKQYFSRSVSRWATDVDSNVRGLLKSEYERKKQLLGDRYHSRDDIDYDTKIVVGLISEHGSLAELSVLNAFRVLFPRWMQDIQFSSYLTAMHPEARDSRVVWVHDINTSYCGSLLAEAPPSSIWSPIP